MSGPNSFNTPTDFLATACSSASDKLPAPGISRSITYWGMATSPNSDGSRFFTRKCIPPCQCKTPQMGPDTPFCFGTSTTCPDTPAHVDDEYLHSNSGLLNGCRNDAGVSRADGVHSHFFGAAIAPDNLLQLLACVSGQRFHGRPRQLGFASSSRCWLNTVEIVAWGPCTLPRSLWFT